MKEIPLSRGMVALIDDEDFDRVNQHKWCVMRLAKNTAYAGTYLTGKVFSSLHRFILRPPADMQVDHKNRNALDNRRENLRICTPLQNLMNRSCTSKTGYLGVTTDRGLWKAHIQIHGKHINIGRFKDIEEAAKARDTIAFSFFGEFAALNFPEAGRQ